MLFHTHFLARCISVSFVNAEKQPLWNDRLVKVVLLSHVIFVVFSAISRN